jgi:cobalamin biosynthesis protein CobT
MKGFLLLIFLIINPISDLDKIARVNEAKKEAERAYLAEDYALAMEKYLYLKDSLNVEDDRLMLNLANAQYYANDSANALTNYKSLQASSNREIASLANQQLGAMQFRSKKYKEALQFYKSSLKADPSNDEARYNYELLKKLIKEQEEQQEQNQDQKQQDQENQEQENQEQQNQDQQNQDQQNQEEQEQEQNQEQQQEQQQEEQQENQEEQQEQEEQKPEDQEQQEEKEEQSKPNPIDEEKLKEMKISEEKAMLILEAMKNNEIQYIQQNKRKAKKKKDPSKPDW